MRPLPPGQQDGDIAVMLEMETRKFLFWNYLVPRIENHPRRKAMEIWTRAFMESRQPMLVFHPAFEDYSEKYNQSYQYYSIDEVTQSRHRFGITSKELRFLREALDNPALQDADKTAYVPRGYYGEKGFLRPLGDALQATEYLDKKEILRRVTPELEQNLQAEESGICCPSLAAGFFWLQST